MSHTARHMIVTMTAVILTTMWACARHLPAHDLATERRLDEVLNHAAASWNGEAAIGQSPWPAQSESASEEYPAAEYITAWGVAEDGYRQAEINARASIAEKIRLDVRATTTLESRYSTGGGKTEATESMSSTVDTYTDLSRAELIQIDKTSLTKIDGRYWVFAYLSREEMTSVFSTEYETAAAGFRQIAKLAVETACDSGGCATLYRLAADRFEMLTRKAYAIETVSGRVLDAYTHDLELFRQLESARITYLATTVVALNVTPVNGLPAGSLAAFFSGALSDFGLSVVNGGCHGSDFVLNVDPRVFWELEPIGEVCRVTFELALVSCHTGRVVAFTEISDPRLAVWNMKYESQALEVILDRMSSIRLSERLGECLRSSLPIS